MEQRPSTYETTRRQPTPQIYVASLSDYNNSYLHGVWIDATDEPDNIRAAIAAMLRSSRDPAAEEYAIHDYSDFGGFAVSEYEDIETVHKIACGIAEHGEAFSAYVELVGTEDACGSGFLDTYCGTFDSVRDFADHFRDDMGWDRELDRLRARSGMGRFIVFDYDAFEDTIRSEWHVCQGHDGVHVFSP